MKTFPVSEVFGPTIQGEGPHAGRAAAFLRLGGCNLSCSWCDSAYTWDGLNYDLRQELSPMTVQDIMAGLAQAGTSSVCVVTGGEPLLHQVSSEWDNLLISLLNEFEEIHLETNGTIEPLPLTREMFAHISVSPKLLNAGGHRGKQRRYIWEGWRDVPNAIFKFVIENHYDATEAMNIARDADMPRDRIWFMPQGKTRAELVKLWPMVAQLAVIHKVNATHRLHILSWGSERAR